ncbi:hypothetical protein NXS19_001552 [Fusarium pseudograminearum]|nr:hypothetical protein NXS19_001552 [Fusarium pseudograminearum]
MAVVLQSDDNGYFAGSGLRRSHSQSNFISSTSPFSTSSHLSDHHYSSSNKSYADSNSSSAPSSPRTVHADSVDLSYASTPATNLSIASDYDDHISLAESPEDHFMFPSFAQEKFFVHQDIHPQIHHDDNLEPPPVHEQAIRILSLLPNTKTPKRLLRTHQDPKHLNTKSPSMQRTTLQCPAGLRAKSTICLTNGEKRISGHHGGTL